jgi:hypothetical protein
MENLSHLNKDALLEKLVQVAVKLFVGRQYKEFENVTATVARADEKRFLELVMAQLDKDGYDQPDIASVIRRLAMFPKFQKFFDRLPSLYEQSLFFTNIPELRTRVSMSFFDHATLAGLEIDYDYEIRDHKGYKIFSQRATIRPGETHSFDVEKILSENGLEARFGTFYVNSVFKHLASLRVYAQWYNENGMTTTHEKGALRNSTDLVIYPTVVCDKTHETFLVFSNISDKPVVFNCHLTNSSKELFPNSIDFKIQARGSAMLAVSKYFVGAKDFLQGRAGVLYVRPDEAGNALYYYFIRNLQRNTWQIQHT